MALSICDHVNPDLSIGLLADDLTGALDCAAPFAARGFNTFVALDGGSEPDVRHMVVSVNADTRRLTADDARKRLATGTNFLSGRSVRMVKIDSTMRGHPGVEGEETARACDAEIVLLTPAFPGNGRTVRDGNVHVDGVLLADTEVGQDPLSPLETSSVGEVLSEHSSLRQVELPLEQVRSGDLLRQLTEIAKREDSPAAVICDAETDDDLLRIAKAGMELESVLFILWRCFGRL